MSTMTRYYLTAPCPLCGQDRLHVMRRVTGALFLHCPECEWQLDGPESTSAGFSALDDETPARAATEVEIREAGWWEHVGAHADYEERPSVLDDVAGAWAEAVVSKEVDVDAFVRELLRAVASGATVAAHAGSRSRIELTAGYDTKLLEADSASAKLRMICARLAVLFSERRGTVPPLYGGQTEGELFVDGARMRARLELSNTSDDVGFVVSKLPTTSLFTANAERVERVDDTELERIIHELRSSGWAVFVLSEHIRTTHDFMESVRGTMPLNPPVPTDHWDGLTDSLQTGLYELDEDRIAIVWKRSELMRSSSPDELEIALGTLTDLMEVLGDATCWGGRVKSVRILVCG